MTRDMAEARTTEAELNEVLSSMAWGTIDPETSEWLLQSEEPTLAPPEPSLISYAEFIARTYPVDATTLTEVAAENASLSAAKRGTFTNPEEPGAAMRPLFDTMVRNLTLQSKALMKAYDLKKVVLNENELPEDKAKTDAQNILRYCRHEVLPAFWNLLISLTKRNRRFSIIFRTFSQEQLSVISKELTAFCQGQHPAYSGKDKTTKPPLMNGDKGSFDRRLADPGIGFLDRSLGSLTFPKRPADQGSEAAGSLEEGSEDLAQPIMKYTTYDLNESPPNHLMYAGLMEQVLEGEKTAAIIDDFRYWDSKGRQAEAGKLLPVDYAGGFAETKVQHIFFDGGMQYENPYCVDVRDVVSGNPIPSKEAEGVFTHRVDFFQAVNDPEYFVKALEACELEMSKGIIESRKVPVEEEPVSKGLDLKDLRAKEYLYRTVIPALLPALQACQRDRPAEPIEYIAFYMLRHGKQYSKTLKG
jgi:hypothetical protein